MTILTKQRPLTEQDREWRLSLKQRVAEPHASDMVIRMNSTYLELVDGDYSNRGAMSAFGLFAVAVFLGSIFAIGYAIVFRFYLNSDWDRHDEVEVLLSMGILSVILLVSAVGIVTFLRAFGEWFRYTHYPIRLNRKTRMIYGFRNDGTVLAASWDEVHFALRIKKQVAGLTILGIGGLVLKDPQTVSEIFSFGYDSINRDYCLRHWEFIRRYMEEGPQSVIHADGVGLYLPIADKRETLWQGWVELVSNDAWNPIMKWLMLPFHVLFFVGRLVHRATSKVPLWPADVEAACAIEPGDPYLRDSSMNPVGYQ